MNTVDKLFAATAEIEATADPNLVFGVSGGFNFCEQAKKFYT